MLLKRQKLAKQPILTHCPGMSLRKEEFYTPPDLVCGARVSIFGRECLIYDCDDFTKDWYRANLSLTQVPIQLKKPRPNIMYQALPQYNGYGTEEDSLGSVHSLQPKPPKVDMKKMFKQDMHILRFEAKVISTEPDDEHRKFIVSFYCGDDTIQVYEVCDKNSGRMGGKFMERKKHKNPVT
jgi:EF-hand domain-containing protein 1